MSTAKLVIQIFPPSHSDKQSFLEGLRELTITSEKYSWVYMGDAAPIDIPEKDFANYVDALLSRENAPPVGFVKDSVYWAKCGNEVVGRIAIRHELNDYLRKIGGHVGYIVRPSWRGKGVATEMLRQLLQTNRAKSVGQILLTCDETNIASEKTILKNGGRFESSIETEPGKPNKKRFWISLTE